MYESVDWRHIEERVLCALSAACYYAKMLTACCMFTKNMLIVQCHGHRIIALAVFILVLYKSHFHFAPRKPHAKLVT